MSYRDGYNAARYRQVIIRLPKGMEIDTHGDSVSGYVKRLIAIDQSKPAVTWRHKSDGIQCPACYATYLYSMYATPTEWQFCPSCGLMIADRRADGGDDSP